MTNVEIAEVIKNTNMYELACKTTRNINLSDDEATVVAELDTHFKEIGARGVDPDCEIASFIQKAINQERYTVPDELLDAMFERGTIGENDDFEGTFDAKNTLVAYEAAKGGNVKRSYLDTSVLAPAWVNFQIETDLSYQDLERNGWKSVAKITEYAIEEFKNRQFLYIFDKIDAGITSGAENYITVSGASMTQTATDALTLYVNDRANGEGNIVCQSKYAQQMSKMTGYNSQEMLNEIHRTGRLGMIDGVALTPISSAKKLGDKTAVFPDKRVFGVSGKIGILSQRGEMKVYQTMNNNSEQVHLKFANFEFGVAFNKDTLENVCKAVLS